MMLYLAGVRVAVKLILEKAQDCKKEALAYLAMQKVAVKPFPGRD
ncbi:MAG: hypothetical protein NVSMB33_05590 [Ktedonobacteraceae bacterium]